MAKKRGPFYVVVKDEDARTFCVEGPMNDDRRLTGQVVAAQKQGRNIRCWTANQEQSRPEIVQGMKDQFGYAEVQAIYLPQPEERSW